MNFECNIKCLPRVKHVKKRQYICQVGTMAARQLSSSDFLLNSSKVTRQVTAGELTLQSTQQVCNQIKKHSSIARSLSCHQCTRQPFRTTAIVGLYSFSCMPVLPRPAVAPLLIRLACLGASAATLGRSRTCCKIHHDIMTSNCLFAQEFMEHPSFAWWARYLHCERNSAGSSYGSYIQSLSCNNTT